MTKTTVLNLKFDKNIFEYPRMFPSQSDLTYRIWRKREFRMLDVKTYLRKYTGLYATVQGPKYFLMLVLDPVVGNNLRLSQSCTVFHDDKQLKAFAFRHMIR